jgi:hypothetical protein
MREKRLKSRILFFDFLETLWKCGLGCPKRRKKQKKKQKKNKTVLAPHFFNRIMGGELCEI